MAERTLEFYGKHYELVGNAFIENEIESLIAKGANWKKTFNINNKDTIAIIALSFYSIDADAADLRVGVNTNNYHTLELGDFGQTTHEYGPLKMGFLKTVPIDTLEKYPAILEPSSTLTFDIFNDSSALADRTFYYQIRLFQLRELNSNELKYLNLRG